MRVIAIIIAILGLAVFVYGILFVAQSGTAKQEVANEITPLTLDQVNPQYDKVTAAFDKLMAAEEPQIQAGKAQPSQTYAYLSGQRALLGLAKSNIGLAKFVMMSGTVDILLGLGMFLAGIWAMRKSMSAA
jgi:hypothetical protein